MHRRNQASSGTHPLTATAAYLAPPPPGTAYPPLSAVCMPPPPVFTGYAQAVAGYAQPVAAVPPAFRPQVQPPVGGAGPPMATAPMRPAATGYRNTSAPAGSNNVRHPRSSRRDQAAAAAVKSHASSSRHNVNNSIGQTANVRRQEVSPVKQGYSAALASNQSTQPKHNNTHSDTQNLQSTITQQQQPQQHQPQQNAIGASYTSYKQTAGNQNKTVSPTRTIAGPSPNTTRPTPRAKTEGEEDEDPSSTTTKPKRKRSRRRRRKTDGSVERQGALSDGQCDLIRAHSSSNVSRTSTVENEILHFEDEDEFPNLLSAVGGLQSDGGQQLTPASYCDILKGQVVSIDKLVS